MAKRVARRWEHLEWLVNGEGDLTVGRVGPIRCVATAADGHNALAMLVRRSGEGLEDLLTRLDEAVRLAIEEDVFTDEGSGEDSSGIGLARLSVASLERQAKGSALRGAT